MEKQKAIILNHNGGELGNQLWSFISIYAYAKERGYVCSNYSFFEYSRFFNIPVGNIFITILFFIPYNFLIRFDSLRWLLRLWRKYYKVFVLFTEYINKKKVLYSHNSIDIAGVYYLPPTIHPNPELLKLETDRSNIYFDGWLFRNPAGLLKYRQDILTYFAPRHDIQESVEYYITPLRQQYKNIIGVHIRQGDYKTFKGGSLYLSPEHIKKALDEYVRIFNISITDTCFIICSNEKTDRNIFLDLNVRISQHTFIEDLFILASCDAIIGSDSSFGALASYFGNIPHFIVSKTQTDWTYYQNKKEFFENKYSTMTHY